MPKNYSTPASGSKESRPQPDAVHYHTSNRPDAKPPTWTACAANWPEFVALLKASAALESTAAPGSALVPAALVGGHRTKNAVSEINVAAFEVEGVIPDSIHERVQALGWTAATVSTWANGRTETTLNRDEVLRWLGKNGHPRYGGVEINDTSLAYYMGEVPGWLDTCESVRIITDNRPSPGGAVVVIQHDPLPSFLVAVPLVPAFTPASVRKTQGAGINLWGDVLETVQHAVTGRSAVSKEARDPSAMLTLPRARPGVEPVAVEIEGQPLDWRDLGMEEIKPPQPTSAPTFDSVKAMIAALPPKTETPDPAPVLAMIARLDNATHRETLLSALKTRTGASIQSLRQSVRESRRAAGDGAEEGVKVDKSGFRTLVHVGEPDHRQARAFLLKTMEKANANEPAFSLNLGQVMGLRRHNGRAGFQPLTARQFQASVFDHCSFAAHRDGGDLKHRIPDGDICGVVLEGVKPGELPRQPMIRRAPTMAPDGRILDRNGWFGDVLVDLGDLTPPVVSLEPTQPEINAARDLILEDVLGDFMFDDDDAKDGAASRANAVGLLLTPFMRGVFSGPSPVFGIVKPGAGMGGTLLAETVQILFDGRVTAPTPNAQNEEEMQKLLVAAIMGGSSFLCFDNVVSFYSEALKRSITAENIGGRFLGRSELVERPNDFTWIITGINPRLGAEMTRRTCFINLNTRIEFSGARNYRHPDFKDWLRENRSRVIGALLTLARAWFVAGAEPSDDRLDSFQSWAGVIGGVLKTAGIEGFLTNKREARADREGAEIKSFMGDWWTKFGQADTLEKTAFEHAVDIGAGILTGFGDDRRRLFGETLDALRGRVFDLKRDRVIFSVGAEGWCLVHLGKVESDDDADRS